MPSSRCASILVPITWAILASTLCAPLFSQVPDPLQVDKSVFASLSNHFATSPDTVIILLDPATSANDWTDIQPGPILPRLSALVDQIPLDRAVLTPSPQQTSTVYSNLIRDAVWGELILDRTQQQAQSAASKLLYKDTAQKPTSGYAQYLQLRDRYNILQQAWDATTENSRTETMRTTLESAKSDLELRGNAAQYESALETLQSISDLQPSSFRTRTSSRFEGGTTTDAAGNRVFPADLAPVPSADYSQSWTVLKADLASHEATADAAVWPAGYVGPWRFCKAVAPFTDGDERRATSMTQGVISFEAQLVSVDRSWLEEDLFSYRGWKLRDQTIIASDNHASPSSGAQPLMPLLITGVIMARNVSFSGGLPASELHALLNQRRSGFCTGFGPFVLTGSPDLGTVPFTVFKYGGGFYAPGTAIVAVIAKRLPKSPNPDFTTYSWP